MPPPPRGTPARPIPATNRGFAFGSQSAEAMKDPDLDVPTKVIADDHGPSPTTDAAVIASPIEATAEIFPSGPIPATAPDNGASSHTASSASAATSATIGPRDASHEPKGGATPNRGAEPNPFDEQVWRAEGGSDSLADAAGIHPIVGHPLRDAIARLVSSKRNLAIAAGAALVLIVGIVLAAGGDDETPSSGSASTATRETAATAPAPEPEPAPAAEAASEPTADSASDTASAAVSEGAGSAATTEPAEPTPAVAEPPARKPARKRPAPAKPKEPTIAGKQLVVENDSEARAGKPVANAAQADQAAITRARRAYTAGNSRLFAGDPDGAIREYRQALAHYPGYVSGYRGLGLAYAQKGDRANAIKALRTYVRAAPNAKDASIIQRRIQALSAK